MAYNYSYSDDDDYVISKESEEVITYANAKANKKGIFLGLALGLILGIIGWVISFILHNNYYQKEDYSNAKGIKIGSWISAGIAILSSIIAVMSLFFFAWIDSTSIVASSTQTTMCENNLEIIGKACDSYAREHNGNYPTDLSQLTKGYKKYIERIPYCPTANRDTYSGSYKVKQSKDRGIIFYIYCQGNNHELSPNMPAFISDVGIVKDGFEIENI